MLYLLCFPSAESTLACHSTAKLTHAGCFLTLSLTDSQSPPLASSHNLSPPCPAPSTILYLTYVCMNFQHPTRTPLTNYVILFCPNTSTSKLLVYAYPAHTYTTIHHLPHLKCKRLQNIGQALKLGVLIPVKRDRTHFTSQWKPINRG